jgi:hypothetical protein
MKKKLGMLDYLYINDGYLPNEIEHADTLEYYVSEQSYDVIRCSAKHTNHVVLNAYVSWDIDHQIVECDNHTLTIQGKDDDIGISIKELSIRELYLRDMYIYTHPQPSIEKLTLNRSYFHCKPGFNPVFRSLTEIEAVDIHVSSLRSIIAPCIRKITFVSFDDYANRDTLEQDLQYIIDAFPSLRTLICESNYIGNSSYKSCNILYRLISREQHPRFGNSGFIDSLLKHRMTMIRENTVLDTVSEIPRQIISIPAIPRSVNQIGS